MTTLLKRALSSAEVARTEEHRTAALWAVLRKALRDSRKTILWMVIGLVLYTLFVMSFYSSVADQAEDFDKLLREYPEGITSMFYSGDIEEFSISEPGNFIHIEIMIWVVLLTGSIVISQAFNALTNAERDHGLDMLLSLPISRRDYLLGRMLNTVILLLAVLTALFVTFVVSSVIWSEFDVGIGELALGVYGAFFPLVVVAMFVYMLATLVPSSRRFAGPVAYLFLVGSYLLHSFSGAVDQLKDTRSLYLFDYYNAGDIIRNGVTITDWLLLLAVALVYFAVAYWRVDRKELGV